MSAPCKICGAPIDYKGDNAAHGVCWLCFKCLRFKPEMWKEER